MLNFWIAKQHKFYLKATTLVVAFLFLFSVLSAPFVEASFWQERKKNADEFKRVKEPIQLASLSLNLGGAGGLDLNQNNFISGLELEESIFKTQNQISNKITSEKLEKTLEKIEKKRGRKKDIKGFSGIPHKVRDEIQRYGEIVKVHIAHGKISKGIKGKIEVEAPLVIHIQDVHELYGVQKNIASLLNGLMDLGVELVGMEGSSGQLKGIEEYRLVPDQETLLGLAGYLLKQGLLTGVELAGLARKQTQVEFYGVEEKSKYLEQVKSFKRNLKKANEIEKWLKSLEAKISLLKEKIYSPKMKEFDACKTQFKKGEKKLGEWVRYLESNSSREKLEVQSSTDLPLGLHAFRFSNIKKFLRAYNQEKELDFKKVEKDQQALLKELSEKLSASELVELLEVSLLYRLGKIEIGEFYGFLKEKWDQAKVKLNPELERYISYVLVVESIDKEQLFVELKIIEESYFLKTASAKNPFQEALFRLDQDVQLLETVLDYKLSPEDWREYRKREKDIYKIEERINELFVKANVGEGSFFEDHGIKKLIPFLKNAARFSSCSDQRNKIFVQKLMQRMEEKKCKVTVLVAGGYHSIGIENELKEKGVSYLTIRPRMEVNDLETDVHPLYSFKRELVPLEKLFLPERITIVRSHGLGSGPDFGFLEVRNAIKGIFDVGGSVLSFSKGKKKGIAAQRWIQKEGWQGEIYSAQVRYHGKTFRVWTPRKGNDLLKKNLVKDPEAALRSLNLFKQKYKNLLSGETEIGDSFAIAEVETHSNLIPLSQARKFVKKGAVRFFKIAKAALLSAAFFTGAFGLGAGVGGGSRSGGEGESEDETGKGAGEGNSGSGTDGESDTGSDSGTDGGIDSSEDAGSMLDKALDNLGKLGVPYGMNRDQVWGICVELNEFERSYDWSSIPSLEQRLDQIVQLSIKYGLTIQEMYERLQTVKLLIQSKNLFFHGDRRKDYYAHGGYSKDYYAYGFRYEDLDYWADPEFTRQQIDREFTSRSKIGDWAKEVEYFIDFPGNLIPRDRLTYWADQLKDGDRTQEQIKEFFRVGKDRQLHKKLSEHNYTVRLKVRKGKAPLLDESNIRTIAEEYGLFEPNPFAYSLQDQDIGRYLDSGLDEDHLRTEFEAMQKVREIARDKGFRIKDEQGLSLADLEYWVDQLNEGRYSDDTLADKFAELAMLEVKVNNFDLQRGVRYWNGELRTTPIARDFRPSRKGDVLDINELSDEQRLELERLGILSLFKGEGYISMLAGGASSRMNPQEVPADVQILINEMGYGKKLFALFKGTILGRPIIKSKAVVPIGRNSEGNVLTYLDLFGFNLFRLFESLEREARESGDQELDRQAASLWNNDVALINNWGYRAEHMRLIESRDRYGLKQKIRFFYAPLRIKFFAPPDDVEREKKQFRDDQSYEKALAHAKTVQEKFRDGDEGALIIKGERDPWGHGDYFHELVRSGELLHIIETKKRWCFVRNVDNSAAKFDKVWLELLGLFLKRELDFQPEVSPRSPGQKGGDLIVMTDTPNEDHQLAEHPNIDATYRKKGITNPDSSYWFNDAVAFFTPRYVINIYKRAEQSDEEFVAELKNALAESKKGNKESIERIVERGRRKYPVIWDAKPAKKITALSIKPENNMWQSTGIVEPQIRIKAVGVRGARNIPINQYPNLSQEDKWKILASLRFLSTKGWTKTPDQFLEAKQKLVAAILGKKVEELTQEEVENTVTDEQAWITLETYEGNKILIQEVIDYILKADLFTPGILNPEQKPSTQPEKPALFPELEFRKKITSPRLDTAIYYIGFLIGFISEIVKRNSDKIHSFLGFFAPLAGLGTLLAWTTPAHALNLSSTILKPALALPIPIDLMVPFFVVLGVLVLGIVPVVYSFKTVPQVSIQSIATYSEEMLFRQIRYSEDPKLLNELKEVLKSEKTKKSVFSDFNDPNSIAEIAGILERLSLKDELGQEMALRYLRKILPKADFRILPPIKKNFLLEKMERRIVVDAREKVSLQKFVQWGNLFRANAVKVKHEKMLDAFIKGYGLALWATLSKEERFEEKKSLFDFKGVFVLDVSDPDSLWIKSLLEILALGLKTGTLKELALSANSQSSLDKVKTFLSSRLEKEQFNSLIWILDDQGMDNRLRADFVVEELEKYGLGGRPVKIVTDNFDRWIESFKHKTLIKIIELVSSKEGRAARSLEEITDEVRESLVLLIQQ